MRLVKLAAIVAMVASIGLFILAFAAGTDRTTASAESGDGIWTTIGQTSMSTANGQESAPDSSNFFA